MLIMNNITKVVYSSVYTLLLKQNKFYVGYTERLVDKRFIEHFNNDGSKWTIKYPPVEVLNIVPGTKKDENRITLETMDKYGWWNVRGGSWCKVEMNSCPKALLDFKGIKINKFNKKKYWNEEEDNQLYKELQHGLVTDKIAEIHERSIKDVHDRIFSLAYTFYLCKNSKIINEIKSKIPNKQQRGYDQKVDFLYKDYVCRMFKVSGSDFESFLNRKEKEYKECQRCGRNNHSKENCFASTYITGNFIV